MIETNVHLARRWFDEIWNQRKLLIIYELLTDDSVCHSEMGDLKGADAFVTRGYYPLIGAFPDFRVEIEGTVAEGDEVVVRWKATGTHTGDSLGMPATGRRMTFCGMTWIRYANGKMMEGRDSWNVGGLMEQLK